MSHVRRGERSLTKLKKERKMFKQLICRLGKTAATACLMAMVLPLFSGAGNTLWADAGKTADNSDSFGLETITVTANKIEEDIQDVPQSITIIDDTILKEKEIRNIEDLVTQIPNMNFFTNHGKDIAFRGLTPSLLTYNNPVVIYIDGVAYSNGYGFESSLTNVDRIEVLRGPQGTLYGKDAYGGVIKIVTKDPGDTWQGEVGMEYGSFNYMSGTANISGPVLEDTLYFGINGRYFQDDGWIENDYPGMDEDANQAQAYNLNTFFLFKPTDRFKARLSITRDHSEDDWINGYALTGGTNLGEFNRDDGEHVSFNNPFVEEATNQTQSLDLTYRFDSMTLTATSSHRNINIETIMDSDYGDDAGSQITGFITSETDTWAQEIKLAGNNQEGFRWVAGLYFDYEEIERGPYGFDMYYSTVSPWYGYDYEMNYLADVENTTQALFGQTMIPFGKGFELTLGARFQRYNTEIDASTYNRYIGSGTPPYQYQGEESWDTFLPKAALSYRLNDRWTTYASWSKGYMPGGFNMVATSGTAEDNRFEPQQSTNYELGVKAEFSRLRVAAALFYMDIQDIHIYKYINSYTYITDNADSAHSKGAELEVTYFPTDATEISLGAGIIDAVYDDYDEGNGVTYDGEKIQETPEYTINLGLGYYHPGGFYARTDVRCQGATPFLDEVNKVFSEADAYVVWGMKIGYRFKNLDVYLYGKNLTDEEYITSFKSNASIGSVTTFGDPRTVGIGMRYSF